jgi:hypothetical protein
MAALLIIAIAAGLALALRVWLDDLASRWTCDRWLLLLALPLCVGGAGALLLDLQSASPLRIALAVASLAVGMAIFTGVEVARRRSPRHRPHSYPQGREW